MRKTNDAVILKMIDAGKSQKEIAEHFEVSAAAICNRLKKLRPPPLPSALTDLTEKERRFVLARAQGKTLTQSALESFECGSMDSAKNIGSRLAKRDDIQKTISLIMEEENVGRRHRIRILRRWMNNEHDSQAALKSVDLANRMENLYVEKLVVKATWSEMCQSMAELRKRRRVLEEELGIDESFEGEFEETDEAGTEEQGEVLPVEE
jgi:predicted transcriptional regulator